MPSSTQKPPAQKNGDKTLEAGTAGEVSCSCCWWAAATDAAQPPAPINFAPNCDHHNHHHLYHNHHFRPRRLSKFSLCNIFITRVAAKANDIQFPSTFCAICRASHFSRYFTISNCKKYWRTQQLLNLFCIFLPFTFLPWSWILISWEMLELYISQYFWHYDTVTGTTF